MNPNTTDYSYTTDKDYIAAKQLQLEAAKVSVNDLIRPAYQNIKDSQSILFNQEKDSYDSQIKEAAEIIDQSLKGKTKKPISNTLTSLLKISPDFLNGVSSVYPSGSSVQASGFAGPVEYTDSTNKILMDDSFAESANQLQNTLSILNILKDLNENLYDEIVTAHDESVREIANQLSHVSYDEVVGVAASEGLNPGNNINRGDVRQVSKTINSITDDIERLAVNIKRAFDGMNDTDRSTAEKFGFDILYWATDNNEIIGDSFDTVDFASDIAKTNTKIGRHFAFLSSTFKEANRMTFGALPKGLSKLVKGAKVIGGKALPFLGAGISGYEDYERDKALGKSDDFAKKHAAASTTADLVGTAGGAKIGAAIGTAIAPGIGTVVGGFLGGLAGNWLGRKAVDSHFEKAGKNPKTNSSSNLKPA